MDFLLLGPLEVRHRGELVDLGPRRAARCLLGLLLLEAGRIVSVDRLCDLLWDANPPDNARNILQSHVSRLRARLDPSRSGKNGIRLLTKGDGYVADVDDIKVDSHRFRAITTAAAHMVDPVYRARRYREALVLWRGPLLADVATDRLRDRIGTGFDELRLHAWEACFAAELEAGQHHQIITELVDLVVANPLRERLVHSLMLALYHDGRRACALNAYYEARTRIAETTGLDVGPELVQLHSAILRDEALTYSRRAAATLSARPRQLPADISHFVGRGIEMGQIINAASDSGRFPTAVAISGQGGVGKSALAIRAARILADRYPDGQLYLDLQGATPGLTPLTAHEALERSLRTLGLEGHRIPVAEAEAAAVFRDLISRRRVLVLLDNALNAAQVRPLLPSQPDCFAIITSRSVLSTLDNAIFMHIATLSEDEGVALLSRFDQRFLSSGNRPLATTIVRRCGSLPLALRVVGAKLAARPDWTLGAIADLLEEERSRLDALEQEDLSVRASIALSHRDLGSDGTGVLAADLLTRIGALDCPDVTTPVVSAIVDLDETSVGNAVNRLIEQQILQSRVPGRYGLHDLVRLYARDNPPSSAGEPTDENPVLRALDYYTATATRAAQLLLPGNAKIPDYPSQLSSAAPSDPDGALRWIAEEIANMVAIARQGAALGETAAATVIQMAAALQYPLYDMLFRWRDLLEVGRLVVSLARRTSNLPGEARGHECLTMALMCAQDDGTAATHATYSLKLYEDVSDPLGQCSARFLLGTVYKRMSDLEQSAAHFKHGIEICRSSRLPRQEANLLDNLGSTYQLMNRLDEAIDCHTEGLRIRQEQDHRLGVAASLENLGRAVLRSGQPMQAVKHFTESSSIAGDVGYLMLQASALWGLGDAFCAIGNADRARTAWHESVGILRRLGALEEDEVAEIVAQERPDRPTPLRVLA